MDQKELQRFRSECLSAHNYYRSLHRTAPLIWNSALADSAQSWAEQLARLDCLRYSNERGVGENIASCWGSDLTGAKATQIWYEENIHFDYESLWITSRTRPFCQIIWQETRQLGAAKAKTVHGKELVVARYKPAVTRENLARNIRRPTTNTKPGSDHSSEARRITRSAGLRQFQEECLLTHNEYRFRHGVPPLRWSFQLSWEAQQWAEELARLGELRHNQDDSIGENLAGMLGDELTGREATDMWYNEIEDYDFDSPGYGEDTSNFTQVVWAASENFGVGRAVEGDLSVVVAFYDPPGNIEECFGENVLKVGSMKKSTKQRRKISGPHPPMPDLDMFRIECLVTHNFYRARHGSPPLILTSALTNEAQYWAERLLVTGSREDLENSRIGISLAFLEWKHVSGITLTEMWYSQIFNYNFDGPGFNPETKNFTQLVWNSSRRVGIGKADDGNGFTVVVARYEPVGNIDGLFASNVSKRGFDRNDLETNQLNTDVVSYKVRANSKSASSFLSWENEGTQVIGVEPQVARSSFEDWTETELCPRTSANFLLNRLLEDLDATQAVSVELLSPEREHQTNWSSPSLSLASDLTMSDVDENSNVVSKYGEEVKRQSSTDQFTQLVWIDGTESPRVDEPFTCQEQSNDISMEYVTEQPFEGNDDQPVEVDVEEADAYSEPEAQLSPHDFQCPRPQSICSDIVEIKPGSVLSKISFWEQVSQDGNRGSRIYDDDIENVSPAITSEEDYTEEEEENVDDYQPIETIPEVEEQELEYDDVFPAHIEEGDSYSPVEFENQYADQQFSETGTETLETFQDDEAYSESVEKSHVIYVYQAREAAETMPGSPDKGVPESKDIISSKIEDILEHQKSDEKDNRDVFSEDMEGVLEHEEFEFVRSAEETESAASELVETNLAAEPTTPVSEGPLAIHFVEKRYEEDKPLTQHETKSEEVQVPSDLCVFETLDRDRIRDAYFDEVSHRLELATIKNEELIETAQSLEFKIADDFGQEQDILPSVLKRKSPICEENVVASFKNDAETELDFDILFSEFETVSREEDAAKAQIDSRFYPDADFKKELLEDISDEELVEYGEFVNTMKEVHPMKEAIKYSGSETKISAPHVSVSDEELVEYGESESENGSDDVFPEQSTVRQATDNTETQVIKTQYEVHERREITVVSKTSQPKEDSINCTEIYKESKATPTYTEASVSMKSYEKKENLIEKGETPQPLPLHLTEELTSDDYFEHVTPENTKDQVDFAETIEDDSVYMSEFRVRAAHSPVQVAGDIDALSSEFEEQVEKAFSDAEKLKYYPREEKISTFKQVTERAQSPVHISGASYLHQTQEKCEISSVSFEHQIAQCYPEDEQITSVLSHEIEESPEYLAINEKDHDVEEQRTEQQSDSVLDAPSFQEKEVATWEENVRDKPHPLQTVHSIEQVDPFDEIHQQTEEEMLHKTDFAESYEEFAKEYADVKEVSDSVRKRPLSLVHIAAEVIEKQIEVQQEFVGHGKAQEYRSVEDISVLEKKEEKPVSFVNVACEFSESEFSEELGEVECEQLHPETTTKFDETHELLVESSTVSTDHVAAVIHKRNTIYDSFDAEVGENLDCALTFQDNEAKELDRTINETCMITQLSTELEEQNVFDELTLQSAEQLALTYEDNEFHEREKCVLEGHDRPLSIAVEMDRRNIVYEEFGTEDPEQTETAVKYDDYKLQESEKEVNETEATPVNVATEFEETQVTCEECDVECHEQPESFATFVDDSLHREEKQYDEKEASCVNIAAIMDKRRTVYDEPIVENPEKLDCIAYLAEQEVLEETSIGEAKETAASVAAALEPSDRYDEPCAENVEQLEPSLFCEEGAFKEQDNSMIENEVVNLNVASEIEKRRTVYEELNEVHSGEQQMSPLYIEDELHEKCININEVNPTSVSSLLKEHSPIYSECDVETPEQQESTLFEDSIQRDEIILKEKEDVPANVLGVVRQSETSYDDLAVQSEKDRESSAFYKEDEIIEQEDFIRAEKTTQNYAAVVEKSQTVYENLEEEIPEEHQSQIYQENELREQEQWAHENASTLTKIAVDLDKQKTVYNEVTEIPDSTLGEEEPPKRELIAEATQSVVTNTSAVLEQTETNYYDIKIENPEQLESVALLEKRRTVYTEFETESTEQKESVLYFSEDNLNLDEMTVQASDIPENVAVVLENQENYFEDLNEEPREALESTTSIEDSEAQENVNSNYRPDDLSANIVAIIEKQTTIYDELEAESSERSETAFYFSEEKSQEEEKPLGEEDIPANVVVVQKKNGESYEEINEKIDEVLESAVSYDEGKVKEFENVINEPDDLSANNVVIVEKQTTIYDELETESPEQSESAFCFSEEKSQEKEKPLGEEDISANVVDELKDHRESYEEINEEIDEIVESAVSYDESEMEECENDINAPGELSVKVVAIIEKRTTISELETQSPEQSESAFCFSEEKLQEEEKPLGEEDISANVVDELKDHRESYEEINEEIDEVLESAVSYDEGKVEECENVINEPGDLSANVVAIIEKRATIYDELEAESSEQSESAFCFSEEKSQENEKPLKEADIPANVVAVHGESYEEINEEDDEVLKSDESYEEGEVEKYENVIDEPGDLSANNDVIVEKRTTVCDELDTESPEQSESAFCFSAEKSQDEENSLGEEDISANVVAVQKDHGESYEEINEETDKVLESAVSYDEGKVEECQNVINEPGDLSANVVIVEKRTTIYDELETESPEQSESAFCFSEEKSQEEEKPLGEEDISANVVVEQKDHEEINEDTNEVLVTAVSYDQGKVQERENVINEPGDLSANDVAIIEKRTTIYDELETESSEQSESAFCFLEEKSQENEKPLEEADIPANVVAVHDESYEEINEEDDEVLKSDASYDEGEVEECEYVIDEPGDLSANNVVIVEKRTTVCDELETESPEQSESAFCFSEEKSQEEEKPLGEEDISANVVVEQKDHEEINEETNEVLVSAVSYDQGKVQECENVINEPGDLSANDVAIIEKRTTIYDELETESSEQSESAFCFLEEKSQENEKPLEEADIPANVVAVHDESYEEINEEDDEVLKSDASYDEGEVEECEYVIDEPGDLSANNVVIVEKRTTVCDELETESPEQSESAFCFSEEKSQDEENSLGEEDISANVVAVQKDHGESYEETNEETDKVLESAVSYDEGKVEECKNVINEPGDLSANVVIVEKRTTIYDELETESPEQSESAFGFSEDKSQADEKPFGEADSSENVVTVQRDYRESYEEINEEADEVLKSALSYDEVEAEECENVINEPGDVTASNVALVENRPTIYNQLETESTEQSKSAFCFSEEKSEENEKPLEEADIPAKVVAVQGDHGEIYEEINEEADEVLESTVSYDEGQVEECENVIDEPDDLSVNNVAVVEKGTTIYDELETESSEQSESAFCFSEEKSEENEKLFEEADSLANVVALQKDHGKSYEGINEEADEVLESVVSYNEGEVEESENVIDEPGDLSVNIVAVVEKRTTICDELETESPKQLDSALCFSEEKPQIDEKHFAETDIIENIAAVVKNHGRGFEALSEESANAKQSISFFEDDAVYEQENVIDETDNINVVPTVDNRGTFYEGYEFKNVEQLESAIPYGQDKFEEKEKAVFGTLGPVAFVSPDWEEHKAKEDILEESKEKQLVMYESLTSVEFRTTTNFVVERETISEVCHSSMLEINESETSPFAEAEMIEVPEPQSGQEIEDICIEEVVKLDICNSPVNFAAEFEETSECASPNLENIHMKQIDRSEDEESDKSPIHTDNEQEHQHELQQSIQTEREVEEISRISYHSKERFLSTDISTEVCVGSPVHMAAELDDLDEPTEEFAAEEEEEQNGQELFVENEPREVIHELDNTQRDNVNVQTSCAVYEEEVEIEFVKDEQEERNHENKEENKDLGINRLDGVESQEMMDDILVVEGASTVKDVEEKRDIYAEKIEVVETEREVEGLQSENRVFEEQLEVEMVNSINFERYTSVEGVDHDDLADDVFEEEIEIVRLPQSLQHSPVTSMAEGSTDFEGEVFEEEIEVQKVRSDSDTQDTQQVIVTLSTQSEKDCFYYSKDEQQEIAPQQSFEEVIEIHVPSQISEQHQKVATGETIQEKVKIFKSQESFPDEEVKHETKWDVDKQIIVEKRNGHISTVVESKLIETSYPGNLYEEEVELHRVHCEFPENAELDLYEDEIEVPGYENLFQDEPRKIIHLYHDESDTELEPFIIDNEREECNSEERYLSDVSQDEVQEIKEDFEECKVFIECPKADAISREYEEACEFTPVSPPTIPTAFDEVFETEPEDTIEETIETLTRFEEYESPTEVELYSLVMPQTLIIEDETQSNQAGDVNKLFEEQSRNAEDLKYSKENTSTDEKEVVFENLEVYETMIILEPFEPETDIFEYVESVEDTETAHAAQVEDQKEEASEQGDAADIESFQLRVEETSLEQNEKDGHGIIKTTPENRSMTTTNSKQEIITTSTSTRKIYSSSRTVLTSQSTSQTLSSSDKMQLVSAEDQHKTFDSSSKVQDAVESLHSESEIISTKQETTVRLQQYSFTKTSETTFSSQGETSTLEEAREGRTCKEDRAFVEGEATSHRGELPELGIYEKERKTTARYYVDFSPAGSFEQDSEGQSEESEEYDHVYIQQGQPLEEDLEEFILVRYGDDYTSSEEDTSDHREIYVIPEEEVNESEEETHEKTPKVVVEHLHSGEEEEDEAECSQKSQDQEEEEEEDGHEEERSREEVELKEYERLESLVILEDKLSQMESGDETDELEVFGKMEPAPPVSKSSSEETLQEDEFSETMTGSKIYSMIESEEKEAQEAAEPNSQDKTRDMGEEDDDDEMDRETEKEIQENETCSGSEKETFQETGKDVEPNKSDEATQETHGISSKSAQGSSEEDEEQKEQQPRSGVLSFPRAEEGTGAWDPIVTKSLRTSQSFDDSYSSRSEESFCSETSSHSTPSEDEDMNEFQRQCLRIHNRYRRQHGVLPLTWSPALAADAEKRAEHLVTAGHQNHCGRRDVGENLLSTKGETLSGEATADRWYGEVRDYSFESPAFDARCGNFTQMIWAGTKEFGVARRMSQDGTQCIVARYHPPGNVLGEFKDNVKPGDVEALIASRRRSSSSERPRRMSRRRRSSRSDMRQDWEKFRKECLITHNYYRSLHEAPPLNWSPVLAAEAQKWAERLARTDSFKHSGDKDRGENLAFVWGSELTPMKATEMWYDEVKDYDFSSPGFASNTGHFTQVVWVGTEQFGMAKAVGEDGTQVIVGRYYPPGNIVGSFRENVKPNKFSRR